MSIAAIDMLTDALRLVGIIDENETPSAEQGIKALRTLNQLMAQWDGDGVKIGWSTVEDLDDELPLEVRDERAVLFNLAVDLAGEYQVPPSDYVLTNARELYNALCRRHRLNVEVTLDCPRHDAGFVVASIENG